MIKKMFSIKKFELFKKKYAQSLDKKFWEWQDFQKSLNPQEYDKRNKEIINFSRGEEEQLADLLRSKNRKALLRVINNPSVDSKIIKTIYVAANRYPIQDKEQIIFNILKSKNCPNEIFLYVLENPGNFSDLETVIKNPSCPEHLIIKKIQEPNVVGSVFVATIDRIKEFGGSDEIINTLYEIAKERQAEYESGEGASKKYLVDYYNNANIGPIVNNQNKKAKNFKDLSSILKTASLTEYWNKVFFNKTEKDFEHLANIWKSLETPTLIGIAASKNCPNKIIIKLLNNYNLISGKNGREFLEAAFDNAIDNNNNDLYNYLLEFVFNILEDKSIDHRIKNMVESVAILKSGNQNLKTENEYKDTLKDIYNH